MVRRAFASGPGLFPGYPRLGGFDPGDSRRPELPPPHAPPADFCSTTRPADTSAVFGPRTPERARAAGIRRSPLADCHRSGELPEQPSPQSDDIGHPLSSDRTPQGWEDPTTRRPDQDPASTVLREEERLPTGPGAFHRSYLQRPECRSRPTSTGTVSDPRFGRASTRTVASPRFSDAFATPSPRPP